MKTTFLLFLVNFTFSFCLQGQAKIIYFKNPSFEDFPRAERVPEGWINCGFVGEKDYLEIRTHSTVRRN